jgi:hypothetical protein
MQNISTLSRKIIINELIDSFCVVFILWLLEHEENVAAIAQNKSAFEERSNGN